MTGKSNSSIHFRITQEELSALHSRADPLGISTHKYARHITLQSLENGNEVVSEQLSLISTLLVEALNQIEALQTTVTTQHESLCQGIGNSFFMLLTNKLDMSPSEVRPLLKKMFIPTGDTHAQHQPD